MFRVEDGKDITTEEFNDIVGPFFDVCTEYLEKEVVPEYVSYFIATGYNMNAIWGASFDIHIGSAMDMFNFDCKDYTTLKAKVIKILCNKYRLRIISEDPLDFENADD